MYNHIMIDTIDGNSLDFFNVKSFNFDELLQAYVLLSQNDEQHVFNKADVKHLVM